MGSLITMGTNPRWDTMVDGGRSDPPPPQVLFHHSHVSHPSFSLLSSVSLLLSPHPLAVKFSYVYRYRRFFPQVLAGVVQSRSFPSSFPLLSSPALSFFPFSCLYGTVYVKQPVHRFLRSCCSCICEQRPMSPHLLLHWSNSGKLGEVEVAGEKYRKLRLPRGRNVWVSCSPRPLEFLTSSSDPSCPFLQRPFITYNL